MQVNLACELVHCSRECKWIWNATCCLHRKETKQIRYWLYTTAGLPWCLWWTLTWVRSQFIARQMFLLTQETNQSEQMKFLLCEIRDEISSVRHKNRLRDSQTKVQLAFSSSSICLEIIASQRNITVIIKQLGNCSHNCCKLRVAHLPSA